MSSNTTSERSRCVRRLRDDENPDFTLLCFPYAGASATNFIGLARALAPPVQVLAVQYPGRHDRRRDAFIDNEPELTASIFRAITPWTGGALALYGHSMGGVIAFEVLRRLEAETDVAPRRLFVSGRRGPLCLRPGNAEAWDDARFVAELRSLSGGNSRLLQDPEVLQMVLPVLRNDYVLMSRYRCAEGASVRTPISVLVGDADPQTTVPEARAWSGHTTGGMDLEVFPGGHFFVERHWPRVAELVRQRLQT